MAFCANCGTQMGGGVKFCPSCGTQAGGASPAAPEKEKVGNIRKCPACGAEVPAMSAVCSACGHEFSNVQVTGSIQKFSDKLHSLGEGDALGGNAELIQYIETFPIPTAKEDLIEFVILASSQMKPIDPFMAFINWELRFASFGFFKGTPAYRLNLAWKTKCKQAYQKALIACDAATVQKIAQILKGAKIKV